MSSEPQEGSVREQLSAAEGTIVQNEEELCRQRRLLDSSWNPQLQLHIVETRYSFNRRRQANADKTKQCLLMSILLLQDGCRACNGPPHGNSFFCETQRSEEEGMQARKRRREERKLQEEGASIKKMHSESISEELGEHDVYAGRSCSPPPLPALLRTRPAVSTYPHHHHGLLRSSWTSTRRQFVFLPRNNLLWISPGRCPLVPRCPSSGILLLLSSSQLLRPCWKEA
ncbi:uncharacterized protein LOC144987952 [Oryzias latipes]